MIKGNKVEGWLKLFYSAVRTVEKSTEAVTDAWAVNAFKRHRDGSAAESEF
jgi:hypothetical protein